MTTTETLSVCSLTVFSLSLTLSIWTYVYNQHTSRVLQTSRLHEAWWTSDMMAIRDRVFALCKDHAKGGATARAMVAYYESPLTIEEPHDAPAFAKLLGFYCNLEVCMASGLLQEKLACRLFGESHYIDYQPLIAAVRSAIHASDHHQHALPQWLQTTLELESRLERHGIVFKT